MIKLRSLPNSKTFPRYFESAMYFLAVLAVYNLIYILLISSGFTPSMPIVFWLAIPCIFIHVYNSIESEFKDVNRDKLRETVTFIRLKQMQSLKEKLEDNPEILYEPYKKKSLLYWARHHNNVEANSLIIELMKNSKKAQ